MRKEKGTLDYTIAKEVVDFAGTKKMTYACSADYGILIFHKIPQKHRLKRLLNGKICHLMNSPIMKNISIQTNYDKDDRRSRMKIYISLPISNCALATQYAIAQKTATQIRKLGHEPVNPFETPPPPFEMSEKEQYAHYMGRDIEKLLNCDAA